MEENKHPMDEQAPEVQASEQEEHHDDHNYDGIEELDNPPPRWIMMIFYITIGFSILYGAYFFWLDVGDTQEERYERTSALHDAKYALDTQDDAVLVALTGETDLAEGKAIYSEMACFACHGMNGEGNAVGPNLTDEYWISGCDFDAVFLIIKEGNPAKGMTAFKSQLSDARIQKVASYVLSLKGSAPANPKDPQGEVCE